MAMAPQGRRDTDSNANISDPENPAVEAPPPPPSSATDCAICLGEFAVGDAIRVMPACNHSFHASCIERWLARGRRSSCPTCRAPAADEATNSCAGYCCRDMDFVIVLSLELTIMALFLLDGAMHYFQERK